MFCVFWFLHKQAIPPSLSLFLGLSIPWDTTVLTLDQLITLQWPLLVHVEGSIPCLSLQRLEIIKLSEEVILKTVIGRKLGLLCQTLSQVVNAKEKYLKEIRSATPVNTGMIKWNSLIADIEKTLVFWIDY